MRFPFRSLILATACLVTGAFAAAGASLLEHGPAVPGAKGDRLSIATSEVRYTTVETRTESGSILLKIASP